MSAQVLPGKVLKVRVVRVRGGKGAGKQQAETTAVPVTTAGTGTPALNGTKR